MVENFTAPGDAADELPSAPVVPARSWDTFSWVIFRFFLELLGSINFIAPARNPDAEKMFYHLFQISKTPVIFSLTSKFY